MVRFLSLFFFFADGLCYFWLNVLLFHQRAAALASDWMCVNEAVCESQGGKRVIMCVFVRARVCADASALV